MRSGASRRGLVLLALIVVLGGCTSPTKKHYLKHLSTTIEPVSSRSQPLAGADTGRPAVAAIERNERTPR